MNTFDKDLETINSMEIAEFLNQRSSPCYESELFRIAFPDCPIFDMAPLSLYRKHFLLFHVLFNLQNHFFKENKYLHIHFMRIFLTDYPENGLCRHYNEEEGRFCSAGCHEDLPYCAFHKNRFEGQHLEELSSRYFYLDKKNYDQFDEKSAEAFISGAWEILTQYDEYEESFRILDLPRTADKEMIRSKFRKLAKKYHPDAGHASCDTFNQINRAYRFLIQTTPEI